MSDPIPETSVSIAREHSPAASGREQAGSPNWSEIVGRIRLGDVSGMEDLYRILSQGVRYYLWRHTGPNELDDRLHDTFLVVVNTIRNGELRDPERLMGFVRTVVRRQVASYVEAAIQARQGSLGIETGARVLDPCQNLEERIAFDERVKIMKKVLRAISLRDREILTRYYLLEQPFEQICREMQLTETQFRLLKSRAKTRFGELGRRRISSGNLAARSRRVSGGRA